MQRAQRTFGRFLKRTPNEADVEAMLTDFTESEQMLEKVCQVMSPPKAGAFCATAVASASRGGVYMPTINNASRRATFTICLIPPLLLEHCLH